MTNSRVEVLFYVEVRLVTVGVVNNMNRVRRGIFHSSVVTVYPDSGYIAASFCPQEMAEKRGIL